ncbi:hypothetical protein Bbelb_191270 [Branchiostoma belcheri]|nr:hypothetical protein Bbelb_191270 [Branchiostoma belcheri]
MSACDNFVEHAWKPGTCTNCFLSKGLHSYSDSSAQSVELLQQKIRRASAPDVRRTENGNPVFGRSRSGSTLLARTPQDAKNKPRIPLEVKQHKKATIGSFNMEEFKGQSKVKVESAKKEGDRDLGHELGRTQKLLEKFENRNERDKETNVEEEWQREMEKFMGRISEKSQIAAKSIPRKSALKKKEAKKAKVSVQFAPKVVEVIGQDGGLFSFDGASSDEESEADECEAMDDSDIPDQHASAALNQGSQNEITEDDLEEELNDLIKTVTQIQENGKTSKFSQLRADTFSPVPFIKQKLYNTVPLCRSTPAPRAAVAPLFHQSSDTDLLRNVASNVAPVKPFSVQGEVRKARTMSDSSGSDGIYALPYRAPTGNTPPKSLPQPHYYHVLDNSHSSEESERETPAEKAHKDVKVELYQVSLKPQPNFTMPYRVVDLDPPAMVKPYTIIDIATNPPNEYPDPSIVRKGTEPYYHELWNAGSSPSGSEKSSPSTSGGTAQIKVDTPSPVNGMSSNKEGEDVKTNAGMPPFPRILKDEVGSPKSPHKVPILIDPMAYDNLVGYKGLLHKCSPPNNLKEGEDGGEGVEIRPPKVSNLHANKKGPNQQERGEPSPVLSTFKPDFERSSPEGAAKKRAPPPPPLTGVVPTAPPKEMVSRDYPPSPSRTSHSPSPKRKGRPAAPPSIQEMVSFIPPPQTDGAGNSFLYSGINSSAKSKTLPATSPLKDGKSSPLGLKSMSPTSPTSPTTSEILSKWSPVGEHKSKKSRGFLKKLLGRNKGELSFVDDSNEVPGDDVVLVNQNLFGGIRSSESSDTLDSIASSRKKSGSSSDASSSEPSPGIRRRMQAFQNNGKDVPIQKVLEKPKTPPPQRSIATQIYQKPYHSSGSSSEKDSTLERPLRQTRPSTKKTAAPPPPRPRRDKTPTRQPTRPPTQGGDPSPAKVNNFADDKRPPRPARPPAWPASPPRRSVSADRLRKSSDSAGEAEYGNTGFARADLETPAKPTRPSLPPALSRTPSPSTKPTPSTKPAPSTPGLRSVLKSPQTRRKQLSPSDQSKDSPPRRPVRVVSPTKEKAAFFLDNQGPPHSYVNVELSTVPNGSLSDDTEAQTSPTHRKPKPNPRPHTPTKDMPDSSYYTQLTAMNKKTLEAVTEKWKRGWWSPVEELKQVKADDIVLIEAVPDCGAEHSVIYRAKVKTLPGKDISVKVCTDSQGRALFQKEVHILQSLPPHPNIYSPAKLIQTQLPRPSHQSQQALQQQSNQSGNMLDSELAVYTQVPTDTLANYVKESKRLHEKDPEVYEKEVSLLLLQLLKGLDHLKNNNISHYDLRLENILLAVDSDKEDSPQLLISNFSHAKLRSDDSRSSADIERLAPEVVQAIRNASDLPYGKCDEFAAGILIYELLHMSNPFRNPSLIQDGYNTKDLPEIPSKSVYSEGLKSLAHSLLQPKPKDRITSTQAVESLQCLFWGPPAEVLDSVEGSAYQEHVYKWLEVEQGKMVNTIVEKCVGNSGGLSLTDGMQCEFLSQLSVEKLSTTMKLVKLGVGSK